MSRPLQDEPFEALERRLAQVKTDRSALTAILHELSFREGPREASLKARAEEAWIQLVIAQAQWDASSPRKPGRDGATRNSADAALSNRDFQPADRETRKDFPGFDPGPMLGEMTTLRKVFTADDSWRHPKRHFAVLAISAFGILALATAQLAGLFRPAEPANASQVSPAPAREVAQLPYIPMGLSNDGASEPASAAGPQPNRPGVVRPVGRINLTTDIANMYAGEGPQIARAAVAAAGLGLNETVRWRNEKSGRHGTVTLIAQNPQRTSCYTARITRLDTKTPQRRTQQLCF